MTKHIYLFLIIGLLSVSNYGQAIIPFADLSDQNRTIFNESSDSHKGDYHNYPARYRNELSILDNDIKEVEQALQGVNGKSKEESLHRKRSELMARRELLLEEAGLLEDLNEFY